MKSFEEKVILKRKELDKILDWVFRTIPLTNENILFIKRLLFAKVACMSHEIKLTNNSSHSQVKHYDREEMRDYLKKYITDKLNSGLQPTKKK